MKEMVLCSRCGRQVPKIKTYCLFYGNTYTETLCEECYYQRLAERYLYRGLAERQAGDEHRHMIKEIESGYDNEARS